MKQVIVDLQSNRTDVYDMTGDQRQQFTAQQKQDQQNLLQQEQQAEQARLAAEAKLTKLGLTVEDLKALLG